MRVVLLIVFGSAGTLARYALQGVVQYRSGSSFPVGTLSVNLMGCFLLGAVGQFALHHLSIPPDWRIALTIGFFGAFTTFRHSAGRRFECWRTVSGVAPGST